MSKITAIRNATLFTQDARRRVLRADLILEDGVIAELRKPGGRGSGPSFDADGLVILPGFVQAHVHLCQTLFRNQADDLELLDWLSKRIWVFEAAHTEETLHTSALLGIHELLSSGTTCILDMGTVRHTGAIFEAVKESGIRANVGKCLMDHPETTPKGLREKTERALSEAADLYERWNGAEKGRIRASFAPRFVISCTEELLREVAALAHPLRGPRSVIHTHASENLKEIQLVKKLVKCENIEYLHQLGLTSPELVLAHCVWLKPNEMGILERTGTHVVHCPSSNMKLASGLAHVPEMRRRKINVALGADGAPCNNHLDMFSEMRMAALIHKPSAGPRAMRAQEVLDMATRDGAKALDWFDQIGSIEVGKRADLVALDLRQPENFTALTPEGIASSVVYSSSPRHVRATWVDGKAVYKDGRVSGIPAERLLKQVEKAQRAIRNRLV